tara:strand:- start:8109 stop:8609 length:501 start_codon:yes stop_codon:yes gene_type:complete
MEDESMDTPFKHEVMYTMTTPNRHDEFAETSHNSLTRQFNNEIKYTHEHTKIFIDINTTSTETSTIQTTNIYHNIPKIASILNYKYVEYNLSNSYQSYHVYGIYESEIRIEIQANGYLLHDPFITTEPLYIENKQFQVNKFVDSYDIKIIGDYVIFDDVFLSENNI